MSGGSAPALDNRREEAAPDLPSAENGEESHGEWGFDCGLMVVGDAGLAHLGRNDELAGSKPGSCVRADKVAWEVGGSAWLSVDDCAGALRLARGPVRTTGLASCCTVTSAWEEF